MNPKEAKKIVGSFFQKVPKDGLCTCGDPKALERVVSRFINENGGWAKWQTDEDLFIISILGSWGVLEHGMSITSAWVHPDYEKLGLALKMVSNLEWTWADYIEENET